MGSRSRVVVALVLAGTFWNSIPRLGGKLLKSWIRSLVIQNHEDWWFEAKLSNRKETQSLERNMNCWQLNAAKSTRYWTKTAKDSIEIHNLQDSLSQCGRTGLVSVNTHTNTSSRIHDLHHSFHIYILPTFGLRKCRHWTELHLLTPSSIALQENGENHKYCSSFIAHEPEICRMCCTNIVWINDLPLVAVVLPPFHSPSFPPIVPQ